MQWFFEIDDSACITINCERRDDFCVRSFDFEKTAEIYRKKWTQKVKNIREKFVINGFLRDRVVFKNGQKLSKNYRFYRKNELFYLFTRNLRENFGALSMLIVVKRD